MEVVGQGLPGRRVLAFHPLSVFACMGRVKGFDTRKDLLSLEIIIVPVTGFRPHSYRLPPV
jgi:hypothetical protein